MTDQNNPSSNPEELPLNPPMLAQPAPEPEPSQAAPVSIGWDQLKRLWACNPLYLVSAALLLYSLYLVAADTTFLKADIERLAFNFGSLQLYEIVVVVTAIWLARRLIWYDSTLLVGLENLLLLVPFILLSEAALIDSHLIWSLSAAAALIGIVRLGTLRRFIWRLNFPPRLLVVSALFLAVNAALPAVYRVLHQSKFGTLPDFGAAYETNQFVWWLLLPVLCGLLDFVPVSFAREQRAWPERGWLPIALCGLWLVGSCVHLYSLTYVYDFPLRPDLVAPGLWAMSWSLSLIVTRNVPGIKPGWRSALWVPPMVATLLAVGQPHKIVFLTLTVLNLASYAVLFRAYRSPVALHLTMVSAVALLAGLPDAWASHIVANFSREKFVAGAGALYALLCVSLRPNPKLGVFGAVLAAVLVGNMAPDNPAIPLWAVQAALVYLLLHSLRWSDSAEHGTRVVRGLAAIAWVIHSGVWVHWYEGGWRVPMVGLFVLAVVLLARVLRRQPGPTAVPVAAALVVMIFPVDYLATHLMALPAGVLAVMGSFLLFGLGTLAALTKNRWLPSQPDDEAGRM